MAKTTYNIAVINRDKYFNVSEGDTLLKGLERSNSDSISVGCRGGGCGLCKVRILQGRYQTKAMSRRHIKDDEQAEGFALACRVLPDSDLVLESDHFNKDL